MDRKTKEDITKKYRLHDKDTGSADVQIALLTEKIQMLTDHMQKNPKDHASRLMLIKYIGQRRNLLNYLNQTDTKRYHSLVRKLGMRY